MQFCRDILMVHHKEKNQKILNYCIEEFHTSTPYDIFWNQSTYPTVSLLLYTWNQNDHCITVCGKWIFDSNLEVALPLTQGCLIIHGVVMTLMKLNLLVSCTQLEQFLLDLSKEN